MRKVSACPALEAVTPLAHSLACKMALREADRDDLVQVALLRYYKYLKEYVPTHRVEKPWSMARAIMRNAMLSYYSYVRTTEKGNRTELCNTTEFRRYSPLAVTDSVTRALPVHRNRLRVMLESERFATQDDTHEQLELSEFYEALEASCGSMARKLVENLVSPVDTEVVEYIVNRSDALAQQRTKVNQKFDRRERTLQNELRRVDEDILKCRQRKSVRSQAQLKKHRQHRAEIRTALAKCEEERRTTLRRMPRGGGQARRSLTVSKSKVADALGIPPARLRNELDRIKEFYLSYTRD